MINLHFCLIFRGHFTPPGPSAGAQPLTLRVLGGGAGGQTQALQLQVHRGCPFRKVFVVIYSDCSD